MVQRSANLNPQAFRDTPLCELPFGDALVAAEKRSRSLSPDEFRETSLRFRIDGLTKCYESYSSSHRRPVFAVMRDVGWYCSSFCSSNRAIQSVLLSYHVLLKNITENTYYTDLGDRMDRAPRLKEVGRASSDSTYIHIPSEVCGVVSECARAMGVSFSLMYQIGMGVAISTESHGLFSAWSERVMIPLLSEFISSGERRLEEFEEIQSIIELRMARHPIEKPGEDFVARLHDVLNP